MILFDDADQLAKLDPIVAGPTLRLPDRAVGRSSSPLPDYETSQAQHERATAVHTPKEKTDKRFWRATLCALCVYVVISAALGIPFIVMVRAPHYAAGVDCPFFAASEKVTSQSSTAMDSPRRRRVDTAQAKSRAFRPLLAGLDRLQLLEQQRRRIITLPLHRNVSYLQVPLALTILIPLSASHSFAPSGTLSVRSNISHEESNIIGNLTVAINPDYNVSSILFQVFLEASSPELRQRTFACFADEGSARGLSLYVRTISDRSTCCH